MVFASIEGMDNIGRSPEWEAERKERLDNLRKRYERLEVHEDAVLEGYHIHNMKKGQIQ